MVEPDQITGLILAGGQGSRLGGVDKGLQLFAGQPLVRHALQRLAPQVGRVMISANRNLEAYRQMGVPVWPDPSDLAGYEGPLAGFLAGLQHCETPYLVTVPCDCPRLPADLVQRLAQALTDNQADLAIARTPLGLEPAFCLIKRELQASLLDFMQSGHRKIERWTALHRRAEAVFDDDNAFFNINTPQDLAHG
ncbi:MAG: molybdenum cofactor guanylyltransferase MobA [Rhizobacter sp.]